MKIPATWTEHDVIKTCPPSASSSTSSSSTKPKRSRLNKPQQCLRFAPTIEVAEIPNRFDYSREEIEDSWFQGIDYDEFRENSYMTVGLYRAGLLAGDNNANSHTHTMRGLEGRLVSREREQTRYAATSAVLNEQYRQFNMGYSYPQAIADKYHAVSWKSQYTAYTKAMLDEQEQTTSKTSSSSFSSMMMMRSPRRSDAKNLLRKVIDIERVDCGLMDASCSSQQHTNMLATTTSTISTDFDINSFFQELTIAAQ